MITTNEKYKYLIISITFFVITLLFYISFKIKEIVIILLFSFLIKSFKLKCNNYFNYLKNKINTKYIINNHYLFIVIIILLILFLFIIDNKIIKMNIFSNRFIEHLFVQIINMILDLIKIISNKSINYINLFKIDINYSIIKNIKNIFSEVIYVFYCILLLFPIVTKNYKNNKYYKNSKLLIEIPYNIKNIIVEINNDIEINLKNFIFAKIIETICIAVLSSFGYYILKLNGCFFLGLYMGLLNNIPFIGPIFGTIIPVAVGLTSSIYKAINTLLVCLLIQLIDNVYLIPFIVSDKIKVNPLISIFMVFTISQLFGALGMIFALPIYLIYKSIFKKLYSELYSK